MCTLIVLDRLIPGLPLVVASNRDEYLARPAAPPARIEAAVPGEPAFVAPQDLEAGGTWMGLNARGLFVGLTNRPTEQKRRDRRSRGLLVLDALRREDAAGLADEMRGLRAESYNPFNLFWADGRRTYVTSDDGVRCATRELEPGLHVLCNRDIDDPSSKKISQLRSRLAGIERKVRVDALFRALGDVLGSHGEPLSPLDHACVHGAEYGTRSSTLLAVGHGRWRLSFADGRPCETKYRNHSALLDDLRQPTAGSAWR
jgi:uncharacterized protein with NRDE domain